MVYEAVLLCALALLATALFVAVVGDSREQPQKSLLQLYLLAVCGVYLVWSWSAGRRTLPMRTWRIRIIMRGGGPLEIGTAVIRYLAAVVGIALGAIGLFWALLDGERQFLHDRVAGTRIVRD
jgi:uncharacterized RDD family membrane protein YckC